MNTETQKEEILQSLNILERYCSPNVYPKYRCDKVREYIDNLEDQIKNLKQQTNASN